MSPTEERRQILQSNYFFRCDCELCQDVEQDLDLRIPICCGKERLVGSRPATEYLSGNPGRMVAFPPKHLRLLPSLKPHACLEPEEVFVCGTCNKVYAAPVLEAFQKRVYEVEDKHSDAMELYKACVAADQDAKLNPYFRLFFRHQDSVLMAYLCRIIISKCKDRELDEDADLMLDCGARTIRWLQAHTNMRELFICYLCLTYSIYLINSIHLLQTGLGDRPSHMYNQSRLNRFIEAFRSAETSMVSCMLFYAQHLPEVAEKLPNIMTFALILGVNR